jgi:hypothetical protein
VSDSDGNKEATNSQNLAGAGDPEDAANKTAICQQKVAQYQQEVCYSLSELLPEPLSDELKSTQSERLALGHTMDKYILTLSGATVSLVGSTYIRDISDRFEWLRAIALILVFSALVISFCNLYFAAKSFELNVALRSLIETAHSASKKAGQSPAPEKFTAFGIVAADIARFEVLEDLSKLIKNSTSDLGNHFKKEDPSTHANSFFKTFAELSRNKYSQIANRLLYTAITSVIFGIFFMLLFLAIKTK